YRLRATLRSTWGGWARTANWYYGLARVSRDSHPASHPDRPIVASRAGCSEVHAPVGAVDLPRRLPVLQPLSPLPPLPTARPRPCPALAPRLRDGAIDPRGPFDRAGFSARRRLGSGLQPQCHGLPRQKTAPTAASGCEGRHRCTLQCAAVHSFPYTNT